MNRSPDDESTPFTFWYGLLLAEFTALLIALATTIVPTKTGSKTGVSGLFFEKPTFAQEFLVNLVGVHLLLMVLALGLFLWVRISSASRSPKSNTESEDRLIRSREGVRGRDRIISEQGGPDLGIEREGSSES